MADECDMGCGGKATTNINGIGLCPTCFKEFKKAYGLSRLSGKLAEFAQSESARPT